MKILFIANRAEFGGAPKSMTELIGSLKDKYGAEIEVVTHGNNFISEWCQKRGIRSYAVGHVPFAVGKGSSPLRRIVKTALTPYYYLQSRAKNKKAFERACEMIDFSDIDIIHTNSNRDSLGAMLSAKYNIPHVWHMREFGREDYDIRYLMPNYIDFMNENTDCFIAISEAVKSVWIKKGLNSNKVLRIYNGIKMPEQAILDAADEHRLRSDKTTRFAFMGIVCPGKGQFDAVKALALLDKNTASQIHIDFWGDCGAVPEYTKQIERYAKKHGVSGSITFRGFTDNVWEELPNYDAALVCSRAEAFGRITPEYMSLGLWVIASATGANPELIEDGVSGYIYENGNFRQLADKLRRVHQSSQEERAKIAANAKNKAHIFTDENNASNVYQLYNEILKRGAKNIGV